MIWKMKISVFSDLHTEHYPTIFWYDKKIPIDAADSKYIVLAGDIGNFGNTGTIEMVFEILSEQYPNKTILYVLGNHEFYGHIYSNVIEECEKICSRFNNVFLLENNSYIDEDEKVIFIGATLWSDFKLANHQEKSLYIASSIIDYSKIAIKDGNKVRNLTPNDTLNLFNKSYDYIEKQLDNEEFNDYKKVVITHFLPIKEVIDPKHTTAIKDLILGAFWASDIPELVSKSDVWIYGHSHSNINLNIEFENGKKVKMLSNQQGYQRFESGDKEINNFINNFTCEI